MSKKNNELDEEITTFDETNEAVTETPDGDPTPDPAPVADGQEASATPETNEAPVDPNPTPDPAEPVVPPTPEKPADDGKDGEKPVDPTPDPTPAKEEKAETEVKTASEVNPFKKFNVRFSYSTDSRSSTTRKSMSVKEMINQFIASPTCFLSLETKENLAEFKAIMDVKKDFKITNKEGKLIDFPESGKKHFIARVTEQTGYFVNKLRK